MQSTKLLPYLKILFETFNPKLEDCWLDGYNIAKASANDQNPYEPDTTNHFYWDEGWWSGFYDSVCDNDINYNDHDLFYAKNCSKNSKAYSSKKAIKKLIKSRALKKEKEEEMIL